MKRLIKTLTGLSDSTKYVLLTILLVITYPLTTLWLQKQIVMYKIYVGNPATMLVVYVAYGWLFEKWWKKKYGKMGLKGWAVFLAGLAIMSVLLRLSGIKIL